MAVAENSTLGALLRDPYRLIQRRLYAQLAESGFGDVTPAHSAVFRNLTADGSRISDLAKRAGMTKQSMGYLVETLTRLGYLELRPDPSDGRAKNVFLTPRGEQLVSTLRRLSLRLETQLRRQIGDAPIESLRLLLQQLTDTLGSDN